MSELNNKRAEPFFTSMKPSKLDKFMYALMKEAKRYSFMEFIEGWRISKQEYEEIKTWFKEEHGIEL